MIICDIYDYNTILEEGYSENYPAFLKASISCITGLVVTSAIGIINSKLSSNEFISVTSEPFSCISSTITAPIISIPKNSILQNCQINGFVQIENLHSRQRDRETDTDYIQTPENQKEYTTHHINNEYNDSKDIPEAELSGYDYDNIAFGYYE